MTQTLEGLLSVASMPNFSINALISHNFSSRSLSWLRFCTVPTLRSLLHYLAKVSKTLSKLIKHWKGKKGTWVVSVKKTHPALWPPGRVIRAPNKQPRYESAVEVIEAVHRNTSVVESGHHLDHIEPAKFGAHLERLLGFVDRRSIFVLPLEYLIARSVEIS